jgi:hypothetical protein
MGNADQCSNAQPSPGCSGYPFLSESGAKKIAAENRIQMLNNAAKADASYY